MKITMRNVIFTDMQIGEIEMDLSIDEFNEISKPIIDELSNTKVKATKTIVKQGIVENINHEMVRSFNRKAAQHRALQIELDILQENYHSSCSESFKQETKEKIEKIIKEQKLLKPTKEERDAARAFYNCK